MLLRGKVVFFLFVIAICMSVKGMENRLVKVKTTDKKYVRLSESVLESSTSLYEQYVSKKAKKIKNIIVFAPVDKASMALFEKGVLSLKDSVIDFKQYYEEIEEKGLLYHLINVAGALQSGELTAQLVDNYFPGDMSKYIASFVAHSATEALRYKIIENNCNHYVKSIHPIRIDPLVLRDRMTSCGCSSVVNYQTGVLSGTGSVSVEVDPAPVLCCKKTNRFLALLGHKFPIASVNFSPNDNVLLTCDYNNATNVHRIIMWDIASFEQKGEARKIKEINGYSSVQRISFCPSSERFVVALDSGIFRIYNGITGECIQYNGHYNRIGNKAKKIPCPGILFGCGGRLLVMMNFGVQSSCSLWNAKTGKKLCSLHDKFRAFKEGVLLEDESIVAAYLTELSGGEKLDLLGEHNRTMLAKFCDVMRQDIVSVYALWRWSLDDSSYVGSDDFSPLPDVIF